MSIKNQREQLIHTATGQATVIIAVLIASWYYSIPQYMELSNSVKNANTTIDLYNKNYKDGFSFEKINELLNWKKEREWLLELIQSAPIETKKILTKTTEQPYLEWINSEMDSNTSIAEKKTLEMKKARINSILPTLNPIDSNETDESMNLRKYIAFIENNIIHQFDIESESPLGIQNIQYGKKNGPIPETIGSFDTEINFKSTNANIAKMLDYINTLGRPDVLINKDSTTETWGIVGVMTNPLTALNSASLEDTIDLTKPNEINQGRITLRFYIRGSSLNDIAYIKEIIRNRKIALGKNIEATNEKCKIELTCPRKKEFQVLSKKYTEFNRGDTTRNSTGPSEIYALSAELDTISSLEKELKNLTGK